jgi:hypothetical protein
MREFQILLVDFILLAEFIAALTAVLFFGRIKNTYWKWFVYYLVFIFIVEAIGKWLLEDFHSFKKYYYNFFVIPIEFLFWYWLYASKSLNNKKVLVFFSGIYSISCIVYFFMIDDINLINSTNYLIGTLLLSILVIMEFFKQIKSDNILNFRQNKMFYINSGVMLFYVATLPFYAFHDTLYEKSKILWNFYGTFALVSCAIMYLLFSAAFIWGKPNI